LAAAHHAAAANARVIEYRQREQPFVVAGGAIDETMAARLALRSAVLHMTAVHQVGAAAVEPHAAEMQVSAGVAH
jgi:hypothetical protein